MPNQAKWILAATHTVAVAIGGYAAQLGKEPLDTRRGVLEAYKADCASAVDEAEKIVDRSPSIADYSKRAGDDQMKTSWDRLRSLKGKFPTNYGKAGVFFGPSVRDDIQAMYQATFGDQISPGALEKPRDELRDACDRATTTFYASLYYWL